MFFRIFAYFTPLLDTLGGEGSAAATAAAEAVDGAAEAAANPLGDVTNILFIVIMAGLIIYMLFIQPRRAQKKKDQMMNAIKVNDTVLTTSGFYGRVAEISGDHFIIEFGDNRSVRVPVRKEAVDSVREPSDKKPEDSKSS